MTSVVEVTARLHQGGAKIKKIVYFVRHGQSEANAAPVFQAPDSPLSKEGLLQAERIAERAKNLQFDALIASTFARARETAQVIGSVIGKEPEYSELFVERVKPSSIDGKPFEDQSAVETWRRWNRSLYTSGMSVEDGENFDTHLARAKKALAYLEDRPETSFLVVTHGYFLRTLLGLVLLGDLLSGEVLQSFQRMASMENTGLTVLRLQDAFEEDPRWRLWVYNDHAHLG